LTQICCYGDNLISLRTSWKKSLKARFHKYSNKWNPTHNWLSRRHPWFVKKWRREDKNTDAVNWNSHNGLIFELEDDFDRKNVNICIRKLGTNKDR